MGSGNKDIPPRPPPLPEQGPGFRFSKEPFACGVHLPLMDDSKLVRLVMRGIDPGRAPDMGPDQRDCTVGGSPEDTGSAGICWDLPGGGQGRCSASTL